MKLSPQMLGVLHSIAHPHPDDEPFPPRSTVKALLARGLVRCVSAREEAANVGRSSMDIIMAALGSQRLVVTAEGRRAVAAALSVSDALAAVKAGEDERRASA